MRARAASTQATRDRIVGAMLEMCLDRWYDEITLRDVADRSGVALQTIVNHFGTKEGLLASMLEDPRAEQEFGGRRLQATPGDAAGAIDLLMADYEHAGEAVIRFLSLESRVPALAAVLAFGRVGHRSWVERTFGPALKGLSRAKRERRVALLICATDVYTWHLLRHDQGLSVGDTSAAIREMVDALHVGVRREKSSGRPP
jgi:AcrR family transcriptional regulator